MSAKTIIQGLEDSQLIKIFLDFVASHRLNYEKNKKEISYKCYEATWVLPVAKATGYGRTETEAYKNALKNLLELLMEDPTYIEYFSVILSHLSLAKNKDPSPPPKLQLKTEGHQPEDNGKMQYQSYTKGQYRGKVDLQHSKINLNRSMSQKGDPEIEEAKNKLKTLEQKLSSVLEENRILKEKLMNQDKTIIKPIFDPRKPNQSPQHLRKTALSQTSQKNLQCGGMSKIAIPKLNLQVLPNYHKKSQKCLNEALMAAYQEKHGAEKVC